MRIKKNIKLRLSLGKLLNDYKMQKERSIGHQSLSDSSSQTISKSISLKFFKILSLKLKVRKFFLRTKMIRLIIKLILTLVFTCFVDGKQNHHARLDTLKLVQVVSTQ